MSYTPTNWQSGDIITAQKLNNMENGIEAASSGGGILVKVEFNGETGYYSPTNHTNSEILAAAMANIPVILQWGFNSHFYCAPAFMEVGGNSPYEYLAIGYASGMYYDGTDKYICYCQYDYYIQQWNVWEEALGDDGGAYVGDDPGVLPG